MISGYAIPYNNYLKSYNYYSDLDKVVKNGYMTDSYIKGTFGTSTATIKRETGDSVRVFTQYNCELEYQSGKVVSVDVINYRDAFSKYKLLINNYSATGGDYSIGLDISLSNFDSKTIKYSYITIWAKNPVKDVVGKKTLTAVGPIEPGSVVSYSFDNAIYSRVAQTLSIQSIKLVYFDGSQRVLTKPMVDAITPTDWKSLK